jgi:hypothetical protein
MEANLESQLNIKLTCNNELRLILDDISPRSPISNTKQLTIELKSHLDLISEDRERLKKQHQSLIQERASFIQDLLNRKELHEELLSKFTQKSLKQIKELEIESRVLSDLCSRKKTLISKMRGLLQSSPIKENTPRPSRPFTYEVNPIKSIMRRESLSPCKKIDSERRKKIAAFRHSVCN